MAVVGYLRTQGLPNARLRMVKSGYSADDPSVPANAVIFDSDANEYLKVYLSGTVQINSDNGSSLLIVPWASLGYIPFVFASWKISNSASPSGFGYFNPFPIPPSGYPGTQMSVKSDGLYADSGGFSTVGYPVQIDYIVFRKDAG
ncbi:hypothetical protein ACVDG5_018355 [Mesorhizobium sp. ORM6]